MSLENKMTDTIISNREKYTTDYYDTIKAVSKSKAIYKGEPVPFLYVPKFYTEEDIRTFEKAANGIFDVVNRTIELYLAEERVRKLFGFDPKLEELIRLPHFYHVNVPMGRFDIFYYGNGQYKFCELNTDGSSAMNEQKELSQVLSKSQLIKDFEGEYSFNTSELFHSWVHAVEVNFRQHLNKKELAKKDKSKTTVAIVDFIDKSTSIEFEVFAEAFQKEGYNCIILDPREISVSNEGYMESGGEIIDVVYRRLVTKDLMDRYEEIPGFIKGLYAGKTCVIGSLKSQVVHTKRFFEVLHHPIFREYLNQEQIAFIDAHIPYTSPLRNDELSSEYIKNKDEYIIKPVDYYASKGVFAGSDYTKDSWGNLLKEKSLEDYIIQQYCPVSLVDNVLANKEGKLERHMFKTITGMFVYNERLTGIYVRGGLNSIISGLHDGYTFATFVIKK